MPYPDESYLSLKAGEKFGREFHVVFVLTNVHMVSFFTQKSRLLFHSTQAETIVSQD